MVLLELLLLFFLDKVGVLSDNRKSLNLLVAEALESEFKGDRRDSHTLLAADRMAAGQSATDQLGVGLLADQTLASGQHSFVDFVHARHSFKAVLFDTFHFKAALLAEHRVSALIGEPAELLLSAAADTVGEGRLLKIIEHTLALNAAIRTFDHWFEHLLSFFDQATFPAEIAVPAGFRRIANLFDLAAILARSVRVAAQGLKHRLENQRLLVFLAEVAAVKSFKCCHVRL